MGNENQNELTHEEISMLFSEARREMVAKLKLIQQQDAASCCVTFNIHRKDVVTVNVFKKEDIDALIDYLLI